MTQDMKVKSQALDGNSIKVVRELTETLTEQDIINRKNQLNFQQAQIKQQMQQLKSAYEQTILDIAACDEQLKLFAELPDIEN